jgi:5-methylthioadenosine/S-adenosylhomocysteine deaminase
MNFIAEMRWAAVLTCVVEDNFRARRQHALFNSAAAAGCKFVQRQDLGRLAPLAKAEMLLINLNHMAAGPYHDPLKALIDDGDSRDIDEGLVENLVVSSAGS